MSITAQHITKHFGDYVTLNDVSLEVGEGELVALLGPSGSGKTTLLRIIAGLEKADAGEVWIGGKPASRMPVRERHVGFVFQHYALFKHMTVFENVAFGLRVRPRAHRPTPAQIRSRVMELLALVHLEQFYSRYPAELSGGQRQRVALARTLAVEPKVLLLDEPFGALDSKVRSELRRWLRRLHDDIRITSIFVTHDQEEAMEVADRVVVMNQGKIEQAGSPEVVYHQPANGFVYDFLGNYNEFAGWKDEHGKVHLAEDDLWEAETPAPTPEQRGLLARYPEVGALLRKFRPAKPLTPLPPIPGKQLRSAMLSARGTPVRVFARPHEMFVTRQPEAGMEYIPVTVTHVNPAGALVKLELQRGNGSILQSETPKHIVDELGIVKNTRLFVRPKNVRVFE